ncbi:hypothetical protein [Fodinicola feengrottensis]|uniref:hypothetical protein n=1 Tax=Fodinicola feengrottensis TaxID=435914 RepID=UPI0013CFD115|nr:hypothetical protein [Fodinicola feengrottensis]
MAAHRLATAEDAQQRREVVLTAPAHLLPGEPGGVVGRVTVMGKIGKQLVREFVHPPQQDASQLADLVKARGPGRTASHVVTVRADLDTP